MRWGRKKEGRKTKKTPLQAYGILIGKISYSKSQSWKGYSTLVMKIDRGFVKIVGVSSETWVLHQ